MGMVRKKTKQVKKRGSKLSELAGNETQNLGTAHHSMPPPSLTHSAPGPLYMLCQGGGWAYLEHPSGPLPTDRPLPSSSLFCFFFPLSLPYFSVHYSPVWMLSSLSCIFATKGKTFPDGSDGKESACNAGDPGSISGSGRSLGSPLQYSCLENSKDRGAWHATVHSVAKSQTRLSDQHFHFYFLLWFSCSANWSVSSNLLHILNCAVKHQLLERWLTES